MSVSNVINASIWSTLTAGTALIASLGGTAIYHLEKTDNATYPLVIYNIQTGSPLNQNPSDLRDVLVQVRAYSTDSAAQAGTIDAQCSTLLHKQTLSVTGYTNYKTVRETDIELVETLPSGAKIYSEGALYRISLDS